MQKIKELMDQIKKAVKKPTKKQKIIAYIVLGALIVGITVPAVYLNRGSLFKGQLDNSLGVKIGSLKGNSVESGYYGGWPNAWGGGSLVMQCSGKPADKRNLDGSIDVIWTGNGVSQIIANTPLIPMNDIQEHFKVLYFGWEALGAYSKNNDGTDHIVDVGWVRSLNQPGGPHQDQANGWASATNSHGTIVDQSIGGKAIKVTYPKDSTKVTATLSGAIIYSDWNYDIKTGAGTTPANAYYTETNCSLNLEMPPTPPKVTAVGKVQKDGYTVLWENTTDTSGNFSVKEYVWVDADGKKISTNHTKTYSQSNPDGAKTADIAPKIVFNYEGTTFKDYFQKNPDKLSVTASYIEVTLTGSAAALTAAQAAATIVTQKTAEIAGYLKIAEDAAKKAKAALSVIKNAPVIIIGASRTAVPGPGGRVQTPPINQLTDAEIQKQIDIAKQASTDAGEANWNTPFAYGLVNGNFLKIDNKSPIVAAIYKTALGNWNTAKLNTAKVKTAAVAASTAYASALTEGKAKFASNEAKKQADKDLAAAKIKKAADDLAAQKAEADAKLAAQQAAAQKALDDQKAESAAALAALKAEADAKLAAQQAANDDAAKLAADQAAAKQAADQAAADVAAQQAADQAAQKAAADAAAQLAADAAAKQAAADAAAQQTPPQTSQLTKTLPTDISGHWAESIIKKAVDLGVIVTNANGLFNPNQPITRADVAVMAMRALAQTSTPCTNVQCGTTFNDNVGDLVTAGYIAKANSLGIIVNAQNFRPYATLTRAEAASILAKMIKYKDPTFHLRTPAECYYHAQWHWSCGTGAPNNIATDINADWEGQYFRSLWDYNPTIFQGKAPHIFAPEDPITNAEMLKIIMNAIRP
ncbi:MAG: S-layer homology domain-containing protein [Candidatus Gracilibacteria bacterium]